MLPPWILSAHMHDVYARFTKVILQDICNMTAINEYYGFLQGRSIQSSPRIAYETTVLSGTISVSQYHDKNCLSTISQASLFGPCLGVDSYHRNERYNQGDNEANMVDAGYASYGWGQPRRLIVE